MSIFVRRCAFSKCIELLRKSNRSIGIRNGLESTTISNNREASTLCSRHTFALLDSIVNTTASNNCMSIRFKSNKKDGKRNQTNDNEGDSDEDSDDELAQFNEGGGKDRNLIRIKVQSLRLDLLIKSVLKISRNKIEKLFYESRIRVNGKKIGKKSISIREGDEVDVVKSFSPDNLENLVISRIEMLSARVDDEEEHIIIVARRFKSLTIENYPGVDCYKSSESD